MEGVPLRSTVDAIGTPTSRHLTKLFTPSTGKTPHHITNSSDYIQTTNSVVVGPKNIMNNYHVFLKETMD
jgi:hypothetical protein